MSLVEDRRAVLSQPEKIIGVTFTDGTRWKIIPGSYTDEDDPMIKSATGQVSFEVTEYTPTGDKKRLILTYSHFIQSLAYDMGGL